MGVTFLKDNLSLFNKVSKKMAPLRKIAKTKNNRNRFHMLYQVCWNFLLMLIILVVVGASFGLGVGAGYFAAVVKEDPVRPKEELDKLLNNYDQTSEIYFAGDILLGKMRTDLEREIVAIDQVSDLVKNAVIATEDEYFYEHHGVVPKAISRAIFQEVTNSQNSSGGSTLTQQVVKMQILTNDASFDRKFKEILLAQRVEKFFTKDQILESYLNVSPFGRNSSGRNIAGVQTASKGVFDKPVNELNIPQAAFIAGLPNSPSKFTPYKSSGELKTDLSFGIDRMKLVLKRMYEHGYISEQEYNDSIAYDIVADFKKPVQASGLPYPYVMSEIEKRAIDILIPIMATQQTYSAEDLQNNQAVKDEMRTKATLELREGGYKIYTTIDKAIYDNMDNTVKEFNLFQSDHKVMKLNPETGKKELTTEPVECGAVMIENATGKILSFVGGRDFNREQLNHATSSYRSNGSTMKPLLIYGPAMDMGYSFPGKPLINAPISIGNYSPSNYGGGSYTGVVSTREALKKSYNVPAVLQYHQIIDQKPATYLQKMGISSLQPEDFSNLAAGIGGLSKGVTVEENVNAYTTFANDGKFIDAYMIEKILDQKGNVIFQHQVNPVDVFSPQTAYLMRDVMQDVVEEGTASSIRSKLKMHLNMVGKTGTGQDFKDAWFVGVTPAVTFGTWMGYDTQKEASGAPSSLNRGGSSYSQRSLSLWAKLCNSAYDANPDVFNLGQKFSAKPDGIVTCAYNELTGGAATKAATAAGLVNSDICNAKFPPPKKDEQSGSVVEINGKTYAAVDSTPSEFIKSGGLIIPEKSFDDMGYRYVTNKSAITAKFPQVTIGKGSNALADNGPPGMVTGLSVNLLGQMTWGPAPSSDVLGYRVYGPDGKRLMSANSGSYYISPLAATGVYTVKAVDLYGHESKGVTWTKAPLIPEIPLPSIFN